MATPFDVSHTVSELKQLANYLKRLNGDTRIVMEYTDKYYEPIAHYLEGLFVCVVHSSLIYQFGNDIIRHNKTNKKDAIKIANYTLEKWYKLSAFTPQDDQRILLTTYNRQYNEYNLLMVMLKINFIALIDQTFPEANTLINSPDEKWID